MCRDGACVFRPCVFIMPTQKDNLYLSAGVPQLENYLLSKELYYPLSFELPQLTLGGILLSLTRMGSRAAKFEEQVEVIHSKWQAAWDVKTSREVRARSELWVNYLAEYREDSKLGAHLYPQNVRYRAMLNLLGRIEDDSDTFVKSVFKEGRFVWEEEIASNFSRKTFWFLYGTLKE
jgi:hypothetical protein